MVVRDAVTRKKFYLPAQDVRVFSRLEGLYITVGTKDARLIRLIFDDHDHLTGFIDGMIGEVI